MLYELIGMNGSKLHASIPLRSLHPPTDNSSAIDPDPRWHTSVTWISPLRKIQRILHPGILHVSGVETSIIHESDIPSTSTFDGVFLSRSRYPFPFAIPFHLTNPAPAASVLVSTEKFSRLQVALAGVPSPESLCRRYVSSFPMSSRHRLFITARWYPARETALCCNTSPPARSYCHNCPGQHHSAYHRHRHHPPPPPDPPEPCVCLNSNRQLCCRLPTSSSSSHGFYSGERIAVVICIWKLSKTGALWSVSMPLSIVGSSPYI